ncbi:hypothetical protein IG631_07844 [Alternaria alternata]|nr:hypothetical protein IG631_07844 [Alternaria alternata]
MRNKGHTAESAVIWLKNGMYRMLAHTIKSAGVQQTARMSSSGRLVTTICSGIGWMSFVRARSWRIARMSASRSHSSSASITTTRAKT